MIAAAVLLASALPFAQSGFAAGDAGWTPQAARPEIAPRSFVATTPSRGEPGALALAGEGNAAASGGWERRLDGVSAGRWYRLTAHYRAERLARESWQVLARLDWLGEDGRRAGQPEYAWRAAADGDWRRLTLEAPAPEAASAVAVQLQLRDGGSGRGLLGRRAARGDPRSAAAPRHDRRAQPAAARRRPRPPTACARGSRSRRRRRRREPT